LKNKIFEIKIWSRFWKYMKNIRNIFSRRDLLIFIFILKTTGTFTPVHSAGYLILRNELRSTQEVARQNIQVSFYGRYNTFFKIFTRSLLNPLVCQFLPNLYTNFTKLSNTPMIRQCALICTHS
jgi:flagellar biosynthesis protein FlhB